MINAMKENKSRMKGRTCSMDKVARKADAPGKTTQSGQSP